MKRKILGFIGAVLMAASALVAIAPAGSAQAAPCKESFLGFNAWFNGLECNADGSVMPPKKDGDGKSLAVFIWTIVMNIIFDLTLAVGYFAVAMVIYGGYLYIMSNGDPTRAAKGQKTLTRAVAGVVIAMTATVIVNTIITVLGIDESKGANQEFGLDHVNNILGWAYAMAGLVAVVFIIKSGIDYTMSRGDPGKVQKATRSIIFSVIGLLVVILAAVITNFVIGSVGGAIK